jgi:hypothetical protein
MAAKKVSAAARTAIPFFHFRFVLFFNAASPVFGGG